MQGPVNNYSSICYQTCQVHGQKLFHGKPLQSSWKGQAAFIILKIMVQTNKP
jgi:hypothetical protein